MNIRIIRYASSKFSAYTTSKNFATESTKRIHIPDPPEKKSTEIIRYTTLGLSVVFISWLVTQFSSPNAVKTIIKSNQISDLDDELKSPEQNKPSS